MVHRRLFAALAIAGLVAAPLPALAQDATPPAGAEACAPMTEADSRALMAAWSANAQAGGDPAALDALVAPDFVAHTPAGDVDYATWQANRASRDAALADAASVTNVELVDEHFGFAHWTRSATHAGEVDGTPASGKTVDWDAMSVMRFECGKVAELWNHFDQANRLDPEDTDEMIAAPEVDCENPVGDEAATEQIARAYNQYGVNSGNLDELEEIVHEDVAMDHPRRDDVSGFRELAGGVLFWRHAFPDLHHEIVGDVVVDGPFAAYLWEATGTDEGGLWGEEPTGKQATWEGITLLEIQCGEVTRAWVEADTAGLYRQLHGG